LINSLYAAVASVMRGVGVCCIAVSGQVCVKRSRGMVRAGAALHSFGGLCGSYQKTQLKGW
jgi:hypothetical protein